MTISNDSCVKIWSPASEEVITQLTRKQNSVDNTTNSAAAAAVISITRDSVTQIWNANNGIALPDPTMKNSTLKFFPKKEKIFTCSSDSAAKIWNVSTGEVIVCLNPNSDNVNNIVLAPNGNSVLAFSNGSSPKIWDLNTGNISSELAGKNNSVKNASFSSDGKKIRTLIEGTVKIWDTPESSIDWLNSANIYNFTDDDFYELGLEFMIEKKE